MDISTRINELDTRTIQDVKKNKKTIYPGTYNLCIFSIQKVKIRECEYNYFESSVS